MVIRCSVKVHLRVITRRGSPQISKVELLVDSINHHTHNEEHLSHVDGQFVRLMARQGLFSYMYHSCERQDF